MRNKRALNLIYFLVYVVVQVGLLGVWLPQVRYSRPQPDRSCCSGAALQVCKQNLQNLGWALDRYVAEHGRYPAKLEDLTPDYLKTQPSCPSAMTSYGYLAWGKEFRLVCLGFNHKELGSRDYPRYSSRLGLRDRP